MTAWWLLSDDYGGRDPSYDRIMGNAVRGTARVNVMGGDKGLTGWAKIYYADGWEHDWRVQHALDEQNRPAREDPEP
jgi:hypothetical protein